MFAPRQQSLDMQLPTCIPSAKKVPFDFQGAPPGRCTVKNQIGHLEVIEGSVLCDGRFGKVLSIHPYRYLFFHFESLLVGF